VTRRLLFVLIALIGLGGVFVAGLATFAGAEDRATFTQGGPIRQVEIDVEAGRVEIVAHPANEATVERTRRYILGEPVVRETFVDGVLRIEAECRRFIAVGCKVDYRVGLPVATALRIRTKSGSVVVQEMGGLIDAETRAGAIRLTRTRGPVQVNTSAGSIEGTDVVAQFVDASTDAGRIRFSLSEPSQRMGLKTGAGGIDLALPLAAGGYRVITETGAGKVEVSVAQDPTAARAVNATTGAGNISIHPR
jgi:hypothetical protein